MLNRRPETVMGHRIAPPRLTPMAIILLILYVGVPVLVFTGLLDLVMQLMFGVCTGLWCLTGEG